MHSALQRPMGPTSKAPVEFFVFPGEGHSPIMLSHLKRKLAEDMKWFDRYLFDAPGQ